MFAKYKYIPCIWNSSFRCQSTVPFRFAKVVMMFKTEISINVDRWLRKHFQVWDSDQFLSWCSPQGNVLKLSIKLHANALYIFVQSAQGPTVKQQAIQCLGKHNGKNALRIHCHKLLDLQIKLTILSGLRDNTGAYNGAKATKTSRVTLYILDKL